MGGAVGNNKRADSGRSSVGQPIGGHVVGGKWLGKQ